MCWKRQQLEEREGAVGVGFGTPKAGSYVLGRRPRTRVQLPRKQEFY